MISQWENHFGKWINYDYDDTTTLLQGPKDPVLSTLMYVFKEVEIVYL